MITHSLVDHLNIQIKALQTENAHLRRMLGDTGASYRSDEDAVVTRLATRQQIYVGMVIDVKPENAEHGSTQFIIRAADRDGDTTRLQYGFAIDDQYRERVDFLAVLDSVVQMALNDFYEDWIVKREEKKE